MNKLPLIFGLLFVLLLPAWPLSAQEAFICRDNYYLALTDGAVLTTVYEVTIDPGSGEVVFDALSDGTSGADLNGLGYRYSDNFIYGVNAETMELYRVGKEGVAQLLGVLAPNRYLRFVGGDVSPDGRYLVLVGNNSFHDVALVFIDLDSPTYEYRELRLSGPEVRSADIAFDPTDGKLYGFDAIGHRLVTYDINTGAVKADFPSTTEALLMGGLFFDSFGQLYGYGAVPTENRQQSFYSIDKQNGFVKKETKGPPASRNDGCSCPYTVGLRASVDQVEVPSCTEVPITLEIANSSKAAQQDLRLEQRFPESFTITDIDNPLEGALSAGGPGSSFFVFEKLNVPLGRHEITITVALQPGAAGTHEFQATLSGLPATLGEVTVSDNPKTLVQGDPTVLIVGERDGSVKEVHTPVCTEDSITLDPGIPEASYRWSNGSTEPAITVTQNGTYGVTISGGCQTLQETFIVNGIGFQLDLGTDQVIELGEGLLLQPSITTTSRELIYSWTSSGDPVPCTDCSEALVKPQQDTWYYLTATDEAGCTASDSVLVQVIYDRNVFIPDAFSPNGDGINDYFYLQSKGSEAVLDFRIYDRWGNLLYQNSDLFTNDPEQGWDGRFRGKAINNGVFYYRASIRFLDGAVVEYRGEVAVVR